MKSLLIFVVVFLMANDGNGEETKKIKAMDDISASLRGFTGFMYTNLANGVEMRENIFFSPLSISQTLGMVMVGSKGTTFSQIRTALLISDSKNYTDLNYKKLFKKIYNRVFNVSRGSTSSKSLMANRMYVMENYPLLEDYRSDLKTYFDAEIVPTNFDDPQATVDGINDWVSNKTGNLITDLLDSDAIEPATRLVLVNALFFQAKWKYKTIEKKEKEEIFHTPGTENHRVPFIQQEGIMRYSINSKEDLIQISIPYKNNEAHLVIMMPRDGRDTMLKKQSGALANYLEDLPKEMESWNQGMVTVRWPKFSIDKKLNMRQVLHSMGVTNLFNPREADLSGITTEEELYVGMFTHRAKLTVNERGTVAAAAAAASLLARSSYNIQITIDRPFLFAIYRRSHILFFGRVSDPLKEQ